MGRTKPHTVRFNEDDYGFICKREQLRTAQSILDFFVSNYMKLYRVEKPSIFETSLKFTPATKESYDGKELKLSQLDEPLQYEKPKGNYFSPVSPTVIVNQFQAYSNELNESRTFEEAKAVAIAFRGDNSLSKMSKSNLEALFNSTIEKKGLYNE